MGKVKMSSEGWIKLYRKIQDNGIWMSEKFTRGQAWVDLLILANHSYSFFYKRGVKIEVHRGQCARSEVELSDRWMWSRSKVKKFLSDLEKEQQVKVEKTNITQIVTIVNYAEYQEKEQQTLQQKSSRRAAEKHIQECKEEKECKEKTSSYSPNFEKFWKEYPRKEGKAKAFTSWKKHKCENGLFEKIMEALNRQKESKDWNKDGGKWIPHCSTWVSGKRWEDEGLSIGESVWQ